MADASRLQAGTPEQNIQEFAETAMKEMLSWYGYDRRESPPPGQLRHDSPPPEGLQRGSPPPPAGGSARHSRPSSPTTDGSTSPCAESPVSAALADGGCKRTPVVCSWCNKLGAQLYTMGSKAFCSEPCFSQSRVANFRKTKLCDWCKNIRDSLNIEYVNGDQQLQFCSEGCLNAYKMNIFCKETEAHIQMLPQLRELVRRSSNDPLITPEMWLRRRPAGAGSDDAISAAAEQVAAPAAGECAGGAAVSSVTSDRRRLRRATRPDLSYRTASRGVRARSNTMPVLELRERARRRPSAPSRPAPVQTSAGAPAATSAAAAPAATPPMTSSVTQAPTASTLPSAAAAWQRYQLLPPRLGVPPPPPALPPVLPPVTVLMPVPVVVPVPIPVPIPVPDSVCRELLARCRQRSQVPFTPSVPARPPPQPAPPQSERSQPADQTQRTGTSECPILKRELEKDSASGSDAEGLDLTVRKRKTDHPRKIKMEHDDFD